MRERDHARVCQTDRDGGGRRGNGPAGGDDIQGVFSGLDVVGELRRTAAFHIQSPERGRLGIEGWAAGKQSVEDVGHADSDVVSDGSPAATITTIGLVSIVPHVRAVE